MLSTPPARWTSSTWNTVVDGATLHRWGTLRDRESMLAMVKSTSPSWAAASRCRTVFVEPPIAMSRLMALLNAALVAMERGRTEASSSSYQRLARETTVRPAVLKSLRRSEWVANREPLPGRERPRASVRQFIELAVNMPEHDPQVGQALASMISTSESAAVSSPAAIMASMRSSLCSPSVKVAFPASIGPPETKTVGMLRRMAAINMPGVILSQLEMHTRASAQ